jgi:formylglycine-generating enzyme required for sulfatase activity
MYKSLIFIVLNFILGNQSLVAQQKEIVNPPHTIRINDSLYIDKTPVTLDFIWEYTAHNLASLFEEAQKKNPSGDQYGSFEVFKRSVKSLDKIADTEEPITPENFTSRKKLLILNTSQELAVEYCAWRTGIVNTVFPNQKVLYRVPTSDELLAAAVIFKNRKLLKTKSKRNPYKYKAKYSTSKYYVFNVGELTSDSTLYYSDRFKKLNTDFTAFRCICEIKEFGE